MPDIFISYARGDRRRVAPIAAALEAEGYTISWDGAPASGQARREGARAQLSDAPCGLVCWTRASAKSDGVLVHTTQAYNQHKLVPVLLQSVEPPMPYNMVRSADLTQWRGDPNDAEWGTVLAEVRALVGQSRPAPAPSAPLPEAGGLGRAVPAPPQPVPVSTPVDATPAKPTRAPIGIPLFVGAGLGAGALLIGAVWAGPRILSRPASPAIPAASELSPLLVDMPGPAPDMALSPAITPPARLHDLLPTTTDQTGGAPAPAAP